MDGEILLMANDEGVFEEYDDTYDMTIHFESKEERDAFIEAMKETLSLEIEEN